MPSNKDRLYVGLYARSSSTTTYHWALLTGPKVETEDTKGTQYHAKERVNRDGQLEWVFEEVEVHIPAIINLLVRVTVAKIEDRQKVTDILRQVPIRQGEPGWTCVGWVKEALELLKADADGQALGTNVIEWERVRDAAIEYCQRKKAEHRFDGKGDFDVTKVATYDLMMGKEITP